VLTTWKPGCKTPKHLWMTCAREALDGGMHQSRQLASTGVQTARCWDPIMGQARCPLCQGEQTPNDWPWAHLQVLPLVRNLGQVDTPEWNLGSDAQHGAKDCTCRMMESEGLAQLKHIPTPVAQRVRANSGNSRLMEHHDRSKAHRAVTTCCARSSGSRMGP